MLEDKKIFNSLLFVKPIELTVQNL